MDTGATIADIYKMAKPAVKVARLLVEKTVGDILYLPRAVRASRSWYEAAGRIIIVASDAAALGFSAVNPTLLNLTSFATGFLFGTSSLAALLKRETHEIVMDMQEPTPLRAIVTAMAVGSLFIPNIPTVAFISGMAMFCRAIDPL